MNEADSDGVSEDDVNQLTSTPTRIRLLWRGFSAPHKTCYYSHAKEKRSVGGSAIKLLPILQTRRDGAAIINASSGYSLNAY